jgi:putative nucleotidyltransferase with HDIG domain
MDADEDRPFSRETLGSSHDGELVRLIVQAAQAGVWRWDLKTNRLQWDATAAQLVGSAARAGESAFGLFLRRVHPSDRESVCNAAQRLRSAPSPDEVRFSVRRGEGVGYLAAKGHLVADGDGHPEYVVGLLRDETEVRRRDREHRAMVAISHALRELDSVDAVVERAFEEICQLFGATRALLALRQGEEERVRVTHARGRWGRLISRTATLDDTSLGGVLHDAPPAAASEKSLAALASLGLKAVKGLAGVLALPLLAGKGVRGVLVLAREERFDDEDVTVARALADVLATALARLDHEQALRDRVRELSILHDIDRAISNSLNLNFVLAEALGKALEHLSVDAAAVYLLDPETNVLSCPAARGFRGAHFWTESLISAKGLLGSVAAGRAPILVQGEEELRKRSLRHKMLESEGFVAYAGFPLFVKNEVVGVLELFHREQRSFSASWVRFAELVAGQIAVAVGNAELHTNLERLHAELLSAYDATIEGWARALEMRDVDTEHHCLRVAERAVELAACFDYSAQRLVYFRRGALLHDIGKIAIPDAILNKPGPLDEGEWELMRQHPRIAIELLRNIKFLEPSLDIPGFHHERWDGSGYPFGLHAAEIPEAARIFAVADVYDALTSDRPYRNAWGELEALHYIATQAGRHFDPAVVRTFVALMTEKGVQL